jgi:O-antigen/teichoic acid export membrane protein
MKKGLPESRFLTSQASTFAAQAGYLASRFFLPAVVLSFLGIEEYGIWTVCFIFVGYAGMGTFGISNVYVRYTAVYVAKGDDREISKMASTGILVSLGVTLVTIASLWLLLPVLVDKFHVPNEMRPIACEVLLYTVAAFMIFDLSFGVFANILEGLDCIPEKNAIWLLCAWVEAVVLVILLYAGMGLRALMYAFIIRLVIAAGLSYLFCKRSLPDLKISWTELDREKLSIMFRFGSVVQLSGLLSTFLYSIEKVIAGIFLGIGAAGLFDIGEKIPVMASRLAGSMNSVYLPAATRDHSRGDASAIRDLFVAGTRNVSIACACLMGFLAPFSKEVLGVWISSDDLGESTALIFVVFAFAYHAHVMTGAGSAVHRAVGRPGRELVYPFSQFFCVVLAVAFGFYAFGKSLEVIAFSVSGAMIVSALGYSIWNCRMLEVNALYLFRRAVLAAAPIYAIGAGLSYAVHSLYVPDLDSRVQCGLLLLGAGLIYSGTLSAFLWVSASETEKSSLRSLIKRLLPKSWVIERLEMAPLDIKRGAAVR